MQDQTINENTDPNLENQYQYYLNRVGLSEKNMHPQQRVETKRAFFAACAQMLVIFREGLGAIEDDKESVRYLDHLWNQTETFWIDETSGRN